VIIIYSYSQVGLLIFEWKGLWIPRLIYASFKSVRFTNSTGTKPQTNPRLRKAASNQTKTIISIDSNPVYEYYPTIPSIQSYRTMSRVIVINLPYLLESSLPQFPMQTLGALDCDAPLSKPRTILPVRSRGQRLICDVVRPKQEAPTNENWLLEQ